MAAYTAHSSTMLNYTDFGECGQEVLDHSALLIDQAVLSDRNYLEMSELLQVIKHTQPTVSGRMDYDYPSITDTAVSELGNVKKIPLPAELVEQFGHMQCNCMMGLFPEISRAWLSIDSDVFLWNYEDGSDLAYFDGLAETILSAALVLPKPGIFQPHIQYLLCLTTPVDIVLLGVSFSKPVDNTDYKTFGEMHLLPEPLFSIPTDNVHFLHVTGTTDGRIFMAGKDGCLYELCYQAEDGWFSRKCRKVNHSTSKISIVLPSFLNFSFVDDDPLVQIAIDDSRHILYTRSEKGTIQVYYLGEDGKGMSRIAAISQQTTVQNAALVAKNIDRTNFYPIVNISAVSKEESGNIHLVAVTHTGIRLYFTTSQFNDARCYPSMLSMVHVRLPPGFSMGSNIKKPSKIHAAHYSKGTLIMMGSQNEDEDLLWLLSSDSFPFQKQLKETHDCANIDGRTWALNEIPSVKANLPNRNPYSGILPPEVVTQHIETGRRFVIINSQGSVVLTKMRAVDQLRQMLIQFGPDSEEVASYFRLHKEQACATCLLLACNYQTVEIGFTEMSTRAFFLHGGEPEYNPQGGVASIGPSGLGGSASFIGSGNMTFATPRPGMHPNKMSTPAPHLSQQLFPSNGTIQSPTANPMSEVSYSWRHNGLCLYLGRILRPLWDSLMVKEFRTSNNQKVYLSSAFHLEEITFVQEKLINLREFMNKNSQFASLLMAENFSASLGNINKSFTGGITDEQLKRKSQAAADTQESASLRKIQALVNRTCECLGLWKILCDHQFHVIADGLSKDNQNSLRHLSFKAFVTTGKELSSFLISSLINMYIDDNAATDAVSEHLRDVCPSLYSIEDAVCSKGNEKLQTARFVQNQAEREAKLQDSLKMYKQIATQVDLPVVCNQFGQARFFNGIVDLALTAASKRDPQGLALHYFKNGEPAEDSQGVSAYSARKDCYKCITETLEYLLSISESHPQAPSVPKVPGPPPPVDTNMLTNTDAEKHAEEVFNMALASDDEMFHVSLYEWLVDKNLPEKLLEVQSPYLETYLKRAAAVYPNKLVYIDLLWKYYEKTKNYSAASRVLAKLADHGHDLSLTQRMEYLSRAAICAKSSTMRTSSGLEGEFLHELEEKMEVARIQLQVFEAVSSRPQSPEVEHALSKLNSELMDITTLYGEYADPFQLPECKLAIIHCAGHYDPTLVESLWQEVIYKELNIDTSKQIIITTMTNKLIELGKKYSGSERYFPIARLIAILEQVSCEHKYYLLNPMFVCNIMLEVGTPMSKLQEIYDRLFKSRSSCCKNLRKPHHLLIVIHDLLNHYTKKPNIVPTYERRLFTNTCLDAVANYLIELHAESSMNEAVSQLKVGFKDLQAKLERLV